MTPRTKHNLRQGAICIPIALAAGWSIAGTIIPRMGDHFFTAVLYVMLTAICFDMFLKMVYPKFAWTRPYEPPTFDFDDPKRVNFTSVQTVSRAHRPGRSSEHIFPTVVVDYDWFAMQQERREEQERLQKELFGGWPDRHPIHSYATIPYTAALCQQIEELGYADEVVKELESQPRRIHEDLLIDIFRDLIFQLRTRPHEKVIFKSLPETHA